MSLAKPNSLMAMIAGLALIDPRLLEAMQQLERDEVRKRLLDETCALERSMPSGGALQPGELEKMLVNVQTSSVEAPWTRMRRKPHRRVGTSHYSSASPEIEAWNAAVDAKKAAKRAAKPPRERRRK